MLLALRMHARAAARALRCKGASGFVSAGSQNLRLHAGRVFSLHACMQKAMTCGCRSLPDGVLHACVRGLHNDVED